MTPEFIIASSFPMKGVTSYVGVRIPSCVQMYCEPLLFYSKNISIKAIDCKSFCLEFNTFFNYFFGIARNSLCLLKLHFMFKNTFSLSVRLAGLRLFVIELWLCFLIRSADAVEDFCHENAWCVQSKDLELLIK